MKRWLLFLLAVPALSAQQTIPWGQEFRVNTTVEGYQDTPSVSGLFDGGFAVCWMSSAENDFPDIYAQRYDTDGRSVGVEFLVNNDTQGQQSDPKIIGLSGGGFVVCWADYSLEGYPDVYARCYRADGGSVGAAFRVNSHTEGNQYSPSAAGLTNGDFIVCWVSDHESPVGYIYAQRYTADGKSLGDEFCVNSSTGFFQENPSVTGLSDGGFVVCWECQDQDGSGYGIFARRFRADGMPAGDDFCVNSCTEDHQRESEVAGLSGGGFVVCWESTCQDKLSEWIQAQSFGADGTPLGVEFRVNTFINNFSINSDVTGLFSGGFAVCWQSRFQDGSEFGIYAQRYDANGEPVGGEFRINSYTENYQSFSSITGLSGGGFVVCWQSDQDSFWSGIYGKRFPPEPLRHELQAFLLKQPVYDATVQTMTPVLIWQAASRQSVAYAEELVYTVYFDTLSDLSTAQQITVPQDTSIKLLALKKGKAWFWKVLAKTCYGDSLWSNVSAFFVSHTATGVESSASAPGQLAVISNYPNPFNSSTTVRFELPTNGYATLDIYDLTGRLVRILAAGSETAGLHTVIWDGMNEAGEFVAAGVYFCRLEFNNSAGKKQVLIQKMSLVK